MGFPILRHGVAVIGRNPVPRVRGWVNAIGKEIHGKFGSTGLVKNSGGQDVEEISARICMFQPLDDLECPIKHCSKSKLR